MRLVPIATSCKTNQICSYLTINVPVLPSFVGTYFVNHPKSHLIYFSFVFLHPWHCSQHVISLISSWNYSEEEQTKGLPAVFTSFPPLSSLRLALMKGSVYFVLVSNSTTRGKKRRKKRCRCGLLATPTQKMQDCINKKVCARRANWCTAPPVEMILLLVSEQTGSVLCPGMEC